MTTIIDDKNKEVLPEILPSETNNTPLNTTNTTTINPITSITTPHSINSTDINNKINHVNPPIIIKVPVITEQPKVKDTPAKETPIIFDADYLHNPSPIYPSESRIHGETGTSLISVEVSETGLPLSLKLHTSSGSQRLDKAALTVIKQWRFIPATLNHQPVIRWINVPIVFKLNEE
jgi:TonB family protein